jgi:phosphoribosylformimino-5-aminoimidazole carboxamide ribotide isomerase
VDIYPAIDIRQGRVVRLSQGEATRLTVYEDDPVAQAERFVGAGARWIHVVDLDRAFGDGDNTGLLDRIAAAVGTAARIQVGGGIRSLDRVREALEAGASRVVLGTAAVTNPALVAAAVGAAGAERVAVGLDARDGRVALRGWTETSAELAVDVARRAAPEGVGTIIYTDISRDGMLVGPDIAGCVALQETGAAVIASGGIGTLDDVRAAARAGLAGVIVGRALYERRFTLVDAIAAA